MKLEGEISEINLIERIVELGRERFTGAVRFESDGIIKILYFKGGDVLSASTNDRADSVDEILLKAGKVTREHVKQALAKRKENETLGDALLGLGFITRKELTSARRVQAIGVIRSISAWTSGSYTIVADYLPKREEGTLFPLQQLLVELIVTEQDRPKFDRALDGGEAVFDKAPTFFDDYGRLGLNEDADAIVTQVDGRRSASEVASASGKDAFNVYKLLHALATLGLLTRAEKPQVSPEDFAVAGVGDAADVWGDSTAAMPNLFDEPAPTEPVASVVSFDLVDDEPAPTLEIPRVDVPEPEPEPEPPPAPPRPVMPAFDAPAQKQDEQWGFDEAQIETVQRAATGPPPIPAVKPTFRPVKIKPKKKSNLGGAIVVGLLLGLLGAAGFFGWKWWEGRQGASAEPTPAVARRTPPPRPALTPVAPAIPETTTTAAGTPAGGLVVAAPPATTTTAPGPVAAPPEATVGTRVERATGGMVITNTSGTITAAPSSDAARQRYDAMARDFAARASGNYTVQFELVCETASVTRALNEGGNKIWFISTTYRGRPCYRVFWGSYDTAEAATRGASEIPASLRGVQPVVIRTPK